MILNCLKKAPKGSCTVFFTIIINDIYSCIVAKQRNIILGLFGRGKLNIKYNVHNTFSSHVVLSRGVTRSEVDIIGC